MTDAEIMKASATEVMKFPATAEASIPYVTNHSDGRVLLNFANGTCARWNPLDDDGQCWQMVDILCGENGEFTLERSYISEFRAYAWYANMDDRGIASHPDRRRAIVLACLRAVGVEGV